MNHRNARCNSESNMSWRFRGEKLNGISGRKSGQHVEISEVSDTNSVPIFRVETKSVCETSSLLHVDAALYTRCQSICSRKIFKTYISSVARNYLHCMENEMSLPGSQKFVTYTYPEAEEPSLWPPILFFVIYFSSNIPSSPRSSKWSW
jgi:hypothetical protein